MAVRSLADGFQFRLHKTILLLLMSLAPAAGAHAAGVFNSGLAIREVHTTPFGVAVFLVDEMAQGGMDLNGDGDGNDRTVVHVYDQGSETVINLGFHSFTPLIVQEQWILFSVGETFQGNTDLNGDGDTGDRVLFTFDPATGAIVNLGLEARVWVRRNRQLVASVEEFGSMSDLNGDGDSNDTVVHLLDIDAGTTVNLGLSAIGTIQLLGREIVYRVSESGEGNTDFNGDGDIRDMVLFIVDPDAIGFSIDNLIESVKNAGLHQGTENSLLVKLENGVKSIENATLSAAANQLKAFINQVAGLSGNRIDESDAPLWIDMALGIIAGLEGV